MGINHFRSKLCVVLTGLSLLAIPQTWAQDKIFKHPEESNQRWLNDTEVTLYFNDFITHMAYHSITLIGNGKVKLSDPLQWDTNQGSPKFSERLELAAPPYLFPLNLTDGGNLAFVLGNQITSYRDRFYKLQPGSIPSCQFLVIYDYLERNVVLNHSDDPQYQMNIRSEYVYNPKFAQPDPDPKALQRFNALNLPDNVHVFSPVQAGTGAYENFSNYLIIYTYCSPRP